MVSCAATKVPHIAPAIQKSKASRDLGTISKTSSTLVGLLFDMALFLD
jgi:hypothetical protein